MSIMSPLSGLPPKLGTLAAQVVDSLASIPKLAAIVLGGSFASGRATATSDLDFGLYYREEAPFAIDKIEKAAKRLAAGGEAVVTDVYQWGPWVNGGAWIGTASGRVDFLYRNLDQVERTIEAATEGRIEHHYGQQPPYGFYSVIYLAETKVAVPLYDPTGEIERLKTRVGEYFLTDKRIASTLNAFGKIPDDYVARMEGILSNPGRDAGRLTTSVQSLHELWAEVVALAEGSYRSHYLL